MPAIVPATLLLFWVRYLVRQDFRGTLLQVLLITISVAAATTHSADTLPAE